MKILRFELSLLSRKLLYTCTCSCVDARSVKICSPWPRSASSSYSASCGADGSLSRSLSDPLGWFCQIWKSSQCSPCDKIILLKPRSRILPLWHLNLPLRRLSEGHYFDLAMDLAFSGSFVVTTNRLDEGLQPWRSLPVSWKT